MYKRRGMCTRKGGIGAFLLSISGSMGHTGGDRCRDEIAPSRPSRPSRDHSPDAQMGQAGVHLGETCQVWPTVGNSGDCGSVGWRSY